MRTSQFDEEEELNGYLNVLYEGEIEE